MIEALTGIIVDGAEFQLPELPSEQDPSWDKLQNALCEHLPAAPVQAPSVHAGIGLVGAGPNSRPFEVKFLYAIPEAAHLPPERTSQEIYAKGSWWWQPYLPRFEDSIGQIVNRASVRYFHEDIFWDRPNLGRYLVAAGEDEKAVVLFADPWATLNSDLRNLLAEIDRSSILNYAVLLIRNGEDSETMAAADKLEDGLRLAFPISYTRGSGDYFCKDLLTSDQLDATIAALLRRMSETIAGRRAASMRIRGEPPSNLGTGKVA